ncbi:MAG: 6,7-dimethyl-8-ribityllumazine synthase [Bacteroidota bacterium]|jgi:6,7-dimethyl-8-ribityllumazine synthase
MATKNLSHIEWSQMPEVGHLSFGIVVSEWNREITENLLKGALAVLKKAGVKKKNITIEYVPGSFELAHGAQLVIETINPDAVITLGSIIKGETPHFDFVSQATAQGIMQVGLQYGLPVIFGVLTDDNIQQSKDRSGGKLGNKGSEAAMVAMKMADLRQRMLVK